MSIVTGTVASPTSPGLVVTDTFPSTTGPGSDVTGTDSIHSGTDSDTTSGTNGDTQSPKPSSQSPSIQTSTTQKTLSTEEISVISVASGTAVIVIAKVLDMFLLKIYDFYQ